ncbi:hypothetical protein R6Q57_014363 [Mikania cordata]
MSLASEKPSKIQNILRVRQMLRRWRMTSTSSTSRRFPASDVPAGHVAICVGANCRRFIVRVTYLNHPIFQKILKEAEEEYGFTNFGPLMIPCEESEFEGIIRFLTQLEFENRKKSSRYAKLEDLQRCCHVDYLGES